MPASVNERALEIGVALTEAAGVPLLERGETTRVVARQLEALPDLDHARWAVAGEDRSEHAVVVARDLLAEAALLGDDGALALRCVPLREVTAVVLASEMPPATEFEDTVTTAWRIELRDGSGFELGGTVATGEAGRAQRVDDGETLVRELLRRLDVAPAR